ncbi:MAG TPA: AlpA family phage regulatory protein [Legionella sp.]|nr:AlpA family phage regulatory protein [Legionella sp.]
MEHRINKPLKQQLLFIQDVEQNIGRNRLTLRRWWSAGKFPKPTKLNGTALAWQTEVIEQWITLNTQA